MCHHAVPTETFGRGSTLFISFPPMCATAFKQFVLLFGVMNWIHLAQDLNQWRGLLNTAMNILVPQILIIS
jgi:hypothetical protein